MPRLPEEKTLAGLRRLLPRLETVATTRRVFPLGQPALDAHLPRGGLAAGALHEIVPESQADVAAAFGFVAALLGCMPPHGPLLFVAAPRGLADSGWPHGHGLRGFGLDPGRLMLVGAGDDRQALWAIEEGLQSGAPAAVVGALGSGLDLKTSQRLQVAAGKSGLPLLLLRPAGVTAASAAVTRWRIAAATGARDRFGLIAGWRWRIGLERCRNGRPGEWLVEWDHAAHRFGLAAPMADPAFPLDPDSQPLALAGRP